MDAILNAAETILLRSGLPALRLSRLLREIVEEVGGAARGLDAPGLRRLLESRPHRFRVLDPWRGPWRFVRSAAEAGRQASTEAWVVAVRDEGDGAGRDPGTPKVVRQIQESVRWLALSIDPASSRGVVRWKHLMSETLAARQRLGRAA